MSAKQHGTTHFGSSFHPRMAFRHSLPCRHTFAFYWHTCERWGSASGRARTDLEGKFKDFFVWVKRLTTVNDADVFRCKIIAQKNISKTLMDSLQFISSLPSAQFGSPSQIFELYTHRWSCVHWKKDFGQGLKVPSADEKACHFCQIICSNRFSMN